MKNITKKTIIIVVTIVIVIVLVLVGLLSYIDEENYYESEQAIKELDFKISSKFELNSYYSSKYYSYYDENVSCNFSISTDTFGIYTDKTGKEYLENTVNVKLIDKVSEITEAELNNYKWYHMSVEGKEDITYYYATKKDDVFYELKYVIRDYQHGDGSNKFCYQQYDKIISTIKFKN